MNDAIFKKWWASRTFWLSILTGVVAALTSLSEQDLDPSLVSIVGIALAVAIAVLRWLTDRPITSFAPAFDRFRNVR